MSSQKRNNPNAEKFNPCLKEQELTYKCFNDNGFDKSACTLHMQNYANCKDFWHAVKGDRMRKGIKPYLPDVEEREQIKKEFLSFKG